MLEIEIKVRVPSIHLIRNNIISSGGKRTEKLTEKDTYYNAPHRDFGETDEALRVREAGGKVQVTYKGPKDTILGSKIREEINLGIESAPVFDTIITRLGFREVATVTKEREYFQLDDFSIALDEVNTLGSFVEVELITDSDPAEAAERIDRIAEKLEIKGERIVISYLELLLSTRS